MSETVVYLLYCNYSYPIYTNIKFGERYTFWQMCTRYRGMDKSVVTGYPSIDKPWMQFYKNYTYNEKLYEGESLFSMLYKRNKQNLDSDALIYFGRRISFGKFFKKIDGYAKRFLNEGIKSGDVVIIIGLNTPDVIASIYALNKIGAVCNLEYASVDPEKLSDYLEKISPKYAIVIDVVWDNYFKVFESSTVEKVFISRISDSMPICLKYALRIKSCWEKLPQIEKQCLLTEKCTESTVDTYRWKNTQAAVVLSTSGTTGVPKKAELSCQALNALAVQIDDLPFEMAPGKSLLCPAPVFLAFGLSLSIHMPLLSGVCLVLTPSPDPDEATKVFYKYKPSYFMGAHAFLDKILEYGNEHTIDLSNLEAILIGGEAASDLYIAKVDDFLKKSNSKACGYRGYGMTELAACSTIETPVARREGTVGIPLCAVNMKVIDQETKEELTYNQTGELCISSPCMMLGYQNNNKEIEEIIQVDTNGNRWISTGDLAKIDEDGFIHVVGRIKRIEVTLDPISKSQVKFFPDYIEKTISEYSQIEKCAVIACDDIERQRVPVAFIKIIDSEDFVLENIVKEFEENNEQYNYPQKWIIVEELPILTTGKVDYKALEKILRS